MGFKDRVDAVKADRKKQSDRINAAKQHREEERIEHVKAAEALMPEVDDALAVLRSLQDASVKALTAKWADDNRQGIALRWVDGKGERILRPPDQRSPRGEKRRWKQKRPAGWECHLRFFRMVVGFGERHPPRGVLIFIPFEGESWVESDAPGASGTLADYVHSGRWLWREVRVNGVDMDREETAEETLGVLLGLLAEHIARLE